MNTSLDQISKWRAAAEREGFEVIAPCEVVLSDGSALRATALVKVGPPQGMIVDPEWSALQPYSERLLADGFGYSVVTIGDEDLSDMIRDWQGED